MSFVDETGKSIRLGAKITTPGGEGAIYEIAGDPTSVAKIYHQAQPSEKSVKLIHLRKVASKSLFDIAAWPVNLIYNSSDRQLVRGFTMPRVRGKEIHRLYGPGDRAMEFPAATWDFLTVR